MMFSPSAHGRPSRSKPHRPALDEAVFVEILSRLPVKSLLRFKCVCKAWYSLITSPHFISTHLKNHAPISLLVDNRLRRPNLFSLSLSVNDTNAHATLEDLPFPASIKTHQPEKFSRVKIYGPCNGIVCLSEGADEITLWNPATRESKLLPRSELYQFPPEAMEDASYTISQVGFGFDAKTNDYKVLQMVMIHTDQMQDLGLYSFRSDSWKKLDPNIDNVPPSFEMQNEQYFSLGAYSISSGDNVNVCWVAQGQGCNDWQMVLFDVSEEKFDVIRLPLEVAETIDHIHHNWRLFSSRESLGLVCYNIWGARHSGVAPFDIWVSPKFCAQPNSWMKLYFVDDLQGPVFFHPWGFLEDGRIIFLDYGGEFLFDHRTAKQMKLHLQGCFGVTSVAFTFKDTQISIS